MKKYIHKAVNFGLTLLVGASLIQGTYLILLGAAPELMEPVQSWINIKTSALNASMFPLLGSSIGLVGLKFFNTALKGIVNDSTILTDNRLSSNENRMTELEANVVGALDAVITSKNTETDLLRQSLSIQNKMLEFYQIESNTKLNVSDSLVTPESKQQLIKWQEDLDNMSLELKTYKLKNIYKITEVVNNIVNKATETVDVIDPRVSEIVGGNDEKTV